MLHIVLLVINSGDHVFLFSRGFFIDFSWTTQIMHMYGTSHIKPSFMTNFWYSTHVWKKFWWWSCRSEQAPKVKENLTIILSTRDQDHPSVILPQSSLYILWFDPIENLRSVIYAGSMTILPTRNPCHPLPQYCCNCHFLAGLLPRMWWRYIRPGRR